MEVKQQYIGELKNMENRIILCFREEGKKIELDIQQPDLANLIHRIIAEHLTVSRENVEIKTDNDKFDAEEFLELLIDVHEEFSEEIDKFYENINTEICTYYNDAKLSDYIINEIKNVYATETQE